MEAAPQGNERQANLANFIPRLILGGHRESPELNYDLIHGTVDVPHAKDPVKYTVSVPHELTDSNVHLFVPGFGGFKRSSRKVRNALAQNEGIAAASYEPVRSAGKYNDLFKAQKAHIDTVEAISQDLPNNRGLQELDAAKKLSMLQLALLPHSMGGIAASHHANRHPESVSKLILIATVGLEGAVMLGFLPRLGASGKKELFPPIVRGEFGGPRDAMIMGWKVLKYYGSHPQRTIGEAGSCMAADIRPLIASARNKGVKTAMYLPANDQLIPALPSYAASGENVDYAEIADDLDHLAPQTRARRVASDLARISLQLNPSISTKRSKRVA